MKSVSLKAALPNLVVLTQVSWLLVYCLSPDFWSQEMAGKVHLSYVKKKKIRYPTFILVDKI